jgi:lipoyl(octanoyl) transferase
MTQHHSSFDGRAMSLKLDPVDWTVSRVPVEYADGVRTMTERAQHIARGLTPEFVWLLEHPPLYTAGTSTKVDDLRNPLHFPLHQTGRGGRVTYHGPGQRIAYVAHRLRYAGLEAARRRRALLRART